MSEQKWIKIGSRVEVRWEFIDRLEGILLDLEDSTGEYSIKDDNGNIHHVKNFGRISQISEREPF